MLSSSNRAYAERIREKLQAQQSTKLLTQNGMIARLTQGLNILARSHQGNPGRRPAKCSIVVTAASESERTLSKKHAKWLNKAKAFIRSLNLPRSVSQLYAYSTADIHDLDMVPDSAAAAGAGVGEQKVDVQQKVSDCHESFHVELESDDKDESWPCADQDDPVPAPRRSRAKRKAALSPKTGSS